MTKQGIIYNLIVGFKLMLISLITGAVLLIPLMVLMGISIGATLSGGDTSNLGSLGILGLLIIPLQWTIQGYFVNKFKSWIFK